MKLKNLLCCFKGSSSQVVQEPPEPPEPPEPSDSDPSEATDSSESINGEDDEVDEEHPFGNNEFLNNAWRHNVELPDDRYPPGSSPPLLSHSGVTFRWHEILDGTLNLRDTNFLGRGNFGRVFRCDFPRINKVGAAKIQDIQNPQAHPEFVAEITTLHAANHPNVIKLLGKCFAPEHRVIVYEFMPKGSLDHLLYAHMPGPGLEQEYQVLSWETRMNIAVGVAEALVYLHDGIKMIHRDIKVGNILLDEDFVPRLTDFGLATRILVDSRGDEQQRNIDPVKGTPGYIAPETEQHALVSSKSDVYSYGVFLFALFTGRKAYEFNRVTRVEKRLTNWLRPVWSREEYMPLVIDVALGNDFSVEGLARLFQAARMCTDPHVHQRPDMRVVELMVREAAAHEVPERPPVTRSLSI
ncbi:probable serine/threonine-protein kinase PBL5 [Eutrema salsugineum]|uniref:probable serine/threonine-protein kinase PBL5 n=1 Tax=Eutrema salsugineum TaxID=72664 RepID=UPI000CECFE31|nr:probable serine/threonine-protein kinase PBL5 [Eutrema salsugineum]